MAVNITGNEITGMAAIKNFFDCPLADIKALTVEDRAELAPLCAAALGFPVFSGGKYLRS